MQLVYKTNERPKFGQNLIFAFQQLLAIMAATILVPNIVGHGMDQSAALFGAGVGTLVYILFTKAKSPAFLGSSFAFLGSMSAAFAGAATVELGYLGLIIGAFFAGLVYVLLSLLIKLLGTNWIVNLLMPAVIIGPTVAIIGFGLSGTAISNLGHGNVYTDVVDYIVDFSGEVPTVMETTTSVSLASPLLALLCGLVTLFVIMLASTYGTKTMKLIPFIIGIIAGYAVAAILTAIGFAADIDAMKITNFAPLKDLVANGVTLSTFVRVPDFTFLTAFGGFKDLSGAYIGTVAVAYVPVAFVVFAEHIADHKNLSSIIEEDLLKDPGLHRTLLGDGVGSMFGSFFGGCPNTTYGESVGCVAITGNASVSTIILTALLCIVISFISPFVAFLATIPDCIIMGGACIALYGFIATSGLKMIQKVDLNRNRNLFVVSVIMVCGIGGLTVTLGQVQLTAVAVALILGVIANILLSMEKKKKASQPVDNQKNDNQ